MAPPLSLPKTAYFLYLIQVRSVSQRTVHGSLLRNEATIFQGDGIVHLPQMPGPMEEIRRPYDRRINADAGHVGSFNLHAAMLRPLILFGVLIVWLTGCGGSPLPASNVNPLEAPPVDSSRVASTAEVAEWRYQQRSTADLDGDGVAEQVILAADVTLSASGDPLWEDGHRWAVYVQPAQGAPTLLYGAFVPNGFAEVSILNPDTRGRRNVLVLERTPQQLRALEVAYAGSGAARSVSSAYYQIDQWLSGTPVLPGGGP